MKSIQNIPFSTILFRGFLGFGSGFCGAIIMGIVLFLSWGVVGDALHPGNVPDTSFVPAGDESEVQVHPLFLHFITLAVFFAILSASLIYTILMTFLDESYEKNTNSIGQIFFGNIFILLLLLPAYLMSKSFFGSSGVAMIGTLHTVFVVLFATTTLELIHTKSPPILSIYGVIMGFLIYLFIGILLLASSSTLFAFLSLPVLFMSINLGKDIARNIVIWANKTYGKNFID